MSHAASLWTIEDLKPKAWAEGDPVHERLAAIQKAEEKLAALQNRPSCSVSGANLDGSFGIHNRKNNSIKIDWRALEDDHPALAVNVVAHEGRHSFQKDCIKNPDRHPEISKETTDKWSQKYKLPGSTPQERQAYLNHPSETDARTYANGIIHSLYPEKTDKIAKMMDENYKPTVLEIDKKENFIERNLERLKQFKTERFTPKQKSDSLEEKKTPTLKM